MTKHDEPVIVAERPDFILCTIFVLVWLLPITYAGLARRSVPLVGTYANDMYRVASLFTQRLQGSVDYYFQIRLEDGWEWENINKRDYASIIMSGNRTRLDRMLQDSVYSPRGMAQRQRLAEYVRGIYEKQHPDRKIVAFRYIMVFFPVGGPLTSQKGGWTEWPIEQVPEGQQRVLSVHYFDGRDGENLFFEELKAEQQKQKQQQRQTAP